MGTGTGGGEQSVLLGVEDVGRRGKKREGEAWGEGKKKEWVVVVVVVVARRERGIKVRMIVRW